MAKDIFDAIRYALEHPICKCKDCEDKKTALQRQLDHPFYKRVDDLRDEIKLETLQKAAEKYPEPFNPASWTIKQLAKHAMAENYDQSNYIMGLYEAGVKLEQRNKKLELLLQEANLKYKIVTTSGDECNAAQQKLLDLYLKNKGVFVNAKI